MISQLRIYTVKDGMMDEWVKLFEELVRDLHAKSGMPVQNTWVDAERKKFIWIRNFPSLEEAPEIERRYKSSPERIARGQYGVDWVTHVEAYYLTPTESLLVQGGASDRVQANDRQGGSRTRTLLRT